MTPLDQFLKEAREKRSVGTFVQRADFAIYNQERFEKLVRVAVEALEKHKKNCCYQCVDDLEDAIADMNEIAGEK